MGQGGQVSGSGATAHEDVLTALLDRPALQRLVREALPAYLAGRRWFAGKSRTVHSVEVADVIGLGPRSVLLFVEVRYGDKARETYVLPLACAEKGPRQGDGPVGAVHAFTGDGFLTDGTADETTQRRLLELILHNETIRGEHGVLTGASRVDTPAGYEDLRPRAIAGEQSNSSIIFGTRFFLKIYRRIETGENPESQVMRFLTDKTPLGSIPRFLGILEYRSPQGLYTVGLMLEYVHSRGDAWQFAVNAARGFFAQCTRAGEPPEEASIGSLLSSRPASRLAPRLRERIGAGFLDMISLLGRHTAELHDALGGGRSSPEFTPEPFTAANQRSLLRWLRAQVAESMNRLRAARPSGAGLAAAGVLDIEIPLLEELDQYFHTRIHTLRIRTHGDYHLGQVLVTGGDFVIIDFEGEPGRPFAQRKVKHPCMRDVAGMLRSLHYAAYGALLLPHEGRPLDAAAAEPFADTWFRAVSGVFLDSYYGFLGASPLLPEREEHRAELLRVYLLEKALYELVYELDNRPAWAMIPVKGILSIAGDMFPVPAMQPTRGSL
jgi:trehalose synthase-fused probable maltokinase